MNTIRTLLTTAGLCLITAVSQAQIAISLAPSSFMPMTPGGSISWSGTLTNTGLQDLYISGDEILISPSLSFTIDDTPLLTPVQLYPLVAGGTYSGLLFTLTAPNVILNGTFNGSFTLLGAADTFNTNPIGSQTFSFNAVPEPEAIALLFTSVLAGTGFIIRNKKRLS